MDTTDENRSNSLGDLHFDIDPSVIFQLGDQLIADDVSALLEVIKNAYDADADWVRLSIEPDRQSSVGEGAHHGRITIEDNGSGMGIDDIRRGWLTISTRRKWQQKHDGHVTPRKNRTPQGDKGLGRLGLQRLGRFCSVETGPTDSDEGYTISIDWDDFRKVETLSAVPLVVSRTGPRRGTKITITGLRDTDSWMRKSTFDDVQQRLSQLISPFRQESDFMVYGEIDHKPIDLGQFAEEILSQSVLRFRFAYEHGVLSLEGQYRLQFLDLKERNTYDVMLSQDKGADFFSYIARQGATRDLGLTYIGTEDVFVRMSLSKSTEGTPGLFWNEGSLADPGPFSGEIASFNLDDRREAERSVFDSRSEYAAYIKRQAGIRIYRDGFGIQPYGLGGNDWLGLNKQQTSGRSFYELRPSNVVGYVALNGGRNIQLEEKTDRGGFVDSPYTKSFFTIMSLIIQDINRANTFLRRQYNEFKLHNARTLVVIEEDSLAALSKRVETTAQHATKAREHLQAKSREISAAIAMAKGAALDVPGTPTSDSARMVLDLFGTAEKAVGDAQALLDTVEAQMQTASKTLAVVRAEDDVLRSQLEQFTNLAALGLSAEAIVHELNFALDRIADQTGNVSHLTDDRRLTQYISYVRNAVIGLRKEIARLSPALQYRREQRDVAKIGVFCHDAIDSYYAPRLARNQVSVDCQIEQDFSVRMNLGKLGQVLDNLIYNSEYWLNVARRHGATNMRISILINEPCLTLWDSGYGVDPTLQSLVFDPFVTGKPQGEGRGLGLFIVRQLLAPYNCAVSLLPEVNSHGRRFKFRIDLSGVVVK